MNADSIQIATQSGYRIALSDPEGSIFLLSVSSTDADLGIAIIGSLNASRFFHPNDAPKGFFDIRGRVVPEYNKWVESIMAKYGYKTKKSLFRNMKNCSIERMDGKIIIKPSFHEKLETWSGNGISENGYVIIPESASPAEIGAGLRLALSRCK
jgi:hypothetical protein